MSGRGEAESGRELTEGLPDGFLDAMGAAYSNDARWKTVRRHFTVEAVRGNRDLQPDTLYFVCAQESHVIRSAAEEPNLDTMQMTVVETGQQMKPIPRGMLVKMGQKEQLWRLSARAVSAADSLLDAEDETEVVAQGGKARLVRSVDLSAFSNLLSAARQSGLVAGLDQIAHVRDCEFRDGHYDRAFGIIERLFVAFRQAAEQRQQGLMEEEARFRSGLLNMTPKEWQQKKQRDTAQTAVVERTRRSFIRVLDGLRGLTTEE